MQKTARFAPMRSKNHAGWHLTDGIAEEKDAGAEPEDRRRKAQIGVHCESRKADIHAVEIVRDVKQHHERDQPPRAFSEDFFLAHAPPTSPSQFMLVRVELHRRCRQPRAQKTITDLTTLCASR